MPPSPLCLACLLPSLFPPGVELGNTGRVHLLLHCALVSGTPGLKQGDTWGTTQKPWGGGQSPEDGETLIPVLAACSQCFIWETNIYRI